MAFQIENEADATNPRDAELDSVDIAVLVQGIGGDGVVSGCAATTNGALVVTVASGVVRIGGVNYPVAGNTVTLTAADATYPRYDLIDVGVDGVADNVDGTAATFAVFPAVTASHVALYVYPRGISDDTVSTADGIDKRVFVKVGGELTEPLYADTHRIYGGTADGATLDLQGNSADFKDAVQMYSPIVFFPSGATWAAAGNSDGIFGKSDQTLIFDYASWSMAALRLAGTIRWDVAAVSFGGVAAFAHTSTHRNEAATVVNGAFNTVTALQDLPTYLADGAAFTVGAHTTLNSGPIVNTTGGGTMAITSVVAVSSSLTVTAGTVTGRTGVQISEATGAGTLTNQIGVAVDQLAKGGTADSLLVLGQVTQPTGDWAIYNTSSYSNFMEGPIFLGTDTGPTIRAGSGTPESAVSAVVGSIFLRTDGGLLTSIYVKESGSGNTGWVGK